MNSAHIKNLIDDYLERVKEKLPSWIRESEEESSEILEEMKEHIWDLAQDIAGGSEDAISPGDIQEAIARMGRPSEIAKEYKKRGTPKIYISAEWWAWYSKVVRFVLAILWGINLIALLFSFGKPFWEIIGSLLGGLWNSTLYATIAVTLIFVALSMEGFLPKDFPDLFGKYKVLMKEEKYEECSGYDCRKQTDSAVKRAKRADQRAKRAEARAHKKEKSAGEINIDLNLTGKKKKKNKPPISVGSLLSDGIWGILWAIFIIVQPIASINAKLTPEFLLWIQLTGFLSFSIAL
ncbi:MAG: HAAS signaling domain-containing protein, partial [Promethearchaeota archaeon]